MTPKPMDPAEQKQQFSLALVRAIASVAGIGVDRRDPDDDSVDLAFSSREHGRPRLEVQVKCSSEDVVTEKEIIHDLKIKNYNDLRETHIVVPRVLIVVLVPKNTLEWLEQTEEQMVARHCAWYMSIRDKPPVKNNSTVRIKIPRTQVLTPDTLRDIMGLSSIKGAAAS